MKHENLETATPSGVPAGETTGPVAAVSTREDLIERLKELSQEICLTYWIGAIDDAIVALETNSEPKCSEHPDAPHGFSRNASHSVGRYVCECEGWVPEPAVPQEPVCRHCSSDQGHFEWCCSNCGAQDTLDQAPQPQRPLLTEDEIFEALDADTDDIATAKNDQESWGVILTMARAIEKKVRGEE